RGSPASTSASSRIRWRSANGRRRSTDSVATRPTSMSSRRSWGAPLLVRGEGGGWGAAALDAGEVEELGDHLGDRARLDLELADPFPHPGRKAVSGGFGVTGQGLGQEADGRDRRAQLMGQFFDELGPDPLQATQLGHVLEDEPDAEDRRAPG